MFDTLTSALGGGVTGVTPISGSLNALSDTIGQIGNAVDALQGLLGPVLRAVPPDQDQTKTTPAPFPDCALSGTLDAATGRLNAVLAQLLSIGNRTCL